MYLISDNAGDAEIPKRNKTLCDRESCRIEKNATNILMDPKEKKLKECCRIARVM
jgi:hypothetical protein